MDIRTISKAIAGTLATIVVAWLARNDVVVDSPTVAGIIEYVIAGIIGFLTVYFAPRNKDGQL